MHEGVHVERLDEPLEAVQAAVRAAEASLYDCIASEGSSHVAFQRVQKPLERPSKCNDQRSKANRSEMVPKS